MALFTDSNLRLSASVGILLCRNRHKECLPTFQHYNVSSFFEIPHFPSLFLPSRNVSFHLSSLQTNQRTNKRNNVSFHSITLAVVPLEAMNAVRPVSSPPVPPLSAIADAFEELAKRIKSTRKNNGQEKLCLNTFCETCYLPSVLFNCLGLAFKFAEHEYVGKLHRLKEASMKYDSLGDILDHDIAHGTVKTAGSLSRNLRRVRQGLDLIRAIFENFLSTNDTSLKQVASTAYAQVCAPYHTWAVRTAVSAGLYALPTRDQLLMKLNETNQSAEKKMRRYINASVPVVEYIDKLYLSRNIRLDW